MISKIMASLMAVLFVTACLARLQVATPWKVRAKTSSGAVKRSRTKRGSKETKGNVRLQQHRS